MKFNIELIIPYIQLEFQYFLPSAILRRPTTIELKPTVVATKFSILFTSPNYFKPVASFFTGKTYRDPLFSPHYYYPTLLYWTCCHYASVWYHPKKCS